MTLKKATRRKAALRVHRFAGVALGGGKTDKTAVAITEYYPDQKRLFLRALREKIRGDQSLYHFLTEEEPGLETVAFDAPLQFPKCIRCELQCPGFEACKQPEIRWLWDEHELREAKKRPNKVFTPYTERCTEVYISNHLEEPFHPPHALGSNAAPLTARAHFLARRLQQVRRGPELIEVFPKLSVWRMGRSLRVPKTHLKFHRHAVDSDEARSYFLGQMIERELAFIYQQDAKMMIENPQAFDAFICSITAFLKFRDQTEPRPPNFPKDEIWIEYPIADAKWF